MINDNLKEGIHQQDTVGLYRRGVQQDRLRWTVETVAVKDRLDHDETLGQVFTIEHMPKRK